MPALVVNAAAPAVILDQRAQLRAARPPPWAHVAGRGLELRDVRVEVEHDRQQLVGRVALHQALVAPVVGRPIWCTRRPSTVSGRSRSVTITRASIAARAVTIVAQPACSSPRSAASSGLTSTNGSGWSSAR